MDKNQTLEVWMRGPVEDVPPLLQPVAHALMQVSEDLSHYTVGLQEQLLWVKPLGMASVGFHLQHIVGVIDRMFAYAANQLLSEEQFAYLANEGKPHASLTLRELIKAVAQKTAWAVNQLRTINESQLTEIRYLGRKRIPTTYIGLLFHAAEHSQRHVGQLLVTIKVVLAPNAF
ncbi:hypothetical protein GCM10023231_40950 [Olivibacter ginsenosidimutans]|uniref:DinB-like domain-containing protein n=1 Tax=Olivibacter ginsenosidimutans TaxID=1176537 RepID=A0ABP9CDH1_9SPHI